MLSVFQRLTKTSLIPHFSVRRELELELAKGRAAEVELHRAMKVLEEKLAHGAEELGRTNADLSREMARCKDVEAQFAAISASVPYGAWVYHLDGTVVEVSTLYLQLIGSPLESVRGRAWFSLIHEDDRERVAAHWKEKVAVLDTWDCEFRIKSVAGGEFRHLLSRGAPLHSPDGGVKSYAGFQLDITDRVKLRDELVQLKCDLEQDVQRKTEELREANRHLLLDLADRMRAEIALRDSEHQLRAMFENALDGMLLLNDERQVLDANESALQLFEYALPDLRTLRWDDLIPVERKQGLEARWTEFLGGGTKRGELEIRRSDGGSRLVAFSSRSHILPGRHLMTLRDITDQREAEDSLRLLSHRLMRLQDDERRRIARELHDSTGQNMMALKMHLDRIGATSLQEEARTSVREASEICSNCSAELRTTSYLLHPPLLDEVGLVPALDWYVTGFSERSGIQVSKEIGDVGKRFTRELNTALFRIIQEALANIHKHADSKDAKVRLVESQELVTLEISDCGKGIHPARLSRRSDEFSGVGRFGVGLTGMRERVRQLGGTLEILPANPGTLIRATFPIDQFPKDQNDEQ